METQLPKRKGAQQPSPTFRPISIVAKRSPISAAAELLFCFIDRRKCCLLLSTLFQRRKFITMSTHLCLQHVDCDAEHRENLSATAETCHY